MNEQLQAWREYGVEVWDDEAINWDINEAGEWAWAELVACATNNDEHFTDRKALKEWLDVTDHGPFITQDMIDWGYSYAVVHDLPADWSLY